MAKKKSDAIYTLQEKIKDITQYLRENYSLGVILIYPSRLSRIDQEYGKVVYGDVLNDLCRIIANMKGNQIRNDDILTINYSGGDKFYIFLSKKRDETKFKLGDIENVAESISRYINKQMFMSVYPLLNQINVGYAVTIYNPLIQEERLIYKLIDDAKMMADYLEFRSITRNKEKLQGLIIKEDIRTIYQPIVDLNSNAIIGYEALSRGPEGAEYENPIVLFSIAEETDLLFELDRVCRKRALINAKGLPEGVKLFVNILPSSINDPEFKGDYFKDFLNNIKISPHNIVFEVSERDVIKNLVLFEEASNYYSDIGICISVDDIGAGYLNIKSLIEFKIDYLKLDISLIRDIDKDPLKIEIVKAMIRIGNNIGAKIIAKGIETKEELMKLLELGLIYGQGFLFSKPGPPFPDVKFTKP